MAPELSRDLICVCRARHASGFELDADLRLPLDRAPITVLFGPSGAGKTTLLRIIAGLDRPTEGTIVFRGTTWFDSTLALAPQQRRAGYLAQDYALFPHLTVAANIAYAAPLGKAPQFLKTFGLSDLAARYPREISAGQRQRVALARALAAEPALLLLDEPLSALDANTRARTRRQLRDLLLSSGVPCIVVTHDRTEAAALGDWIAIIAAGRVRQCGPVHQVFQHPADSQVAESLALPPAGATFIRAEDVALTRDPAQGIAARVVSIAIEGPVARVELDCGFPLVAAISAETAHELALQPGDAVRAIVKRAAE